LAIAWAAMKSPGPTRQAQARLAAEVQSVVEHTPVIDIHTHLYEPAFGPLLLWGIDELLVYHYLVAEAFRHLDLPYDRFWALSKSQQAELIWDTLFVRHSPVSEACRGVLTTLQALGLDVRKRDLRALRRWFAEQPVERHLSRCFQLAGVSRVYMTNSPFDPEERAVWAKGFRRDDRFATALRIDPLVVAWDQAGPALRQWGYEVGSSLSARTVREVTRFLEEWTQRIRPRYLMVSLPPQFEFPSRSWSALMLEKVVLPYCRDQGLPLALMLGVTRGVNPALRLAGDGVGVSNLEALQALCAGFPDNKFLVTVLARENQHQLCVLARKFRNLHPFGCWWFTNVPHLIREITRLRLELVGLSVTVQHSDARVLDQLIYKWRHARHILAQVLTDRYIELSQTGWVPTRAEIQRDVQHLLGGAFEQFCG
jgi:hypothetical protein